MLIRFKAFDTKSFTSDKACLAPSIEWCGFNDVLDFVKDRDCIHYDVPDRIVDNTHCYHCWRSGRRG